MTDVYYRYYDVNWDGTRAFIGYEKYYVVKRTPKGVWVENLWDRKRKRFILNDAQKRYAYPTKELALNSYKQRKEWQIHHARCAIARAESVLKMLENASEPYEPQAFTLIPFGIGLFGGEAE